MYNHLRGRVVLNHPTRIVLEVGGVGWELAVPLSTSRALPEAGAEALLLTHLVVREDLLQLIGFATEEERLLFRTLIGLNGVGPSLALQILSATTPREFALAVEKQDATALRRIKGIGEKTAKRIILELKGAKTLLLPDEGEAEGAPAGTAGDAAAALETMGLTRREALHRVERVLANHPDAALEEIVRLALRGAE